MCVTWINEWMACKIITSRHTGHSKFIGGIGILWRRARGREHTRQVICLTHPTSISISWCLCVPDVVSEAGDTEVGEPCSLPLPRVSVLKWRDQIGQNGLIAIKKKIGMSSEDTVEGGLKSAWKLERDFSLEKRWELTGHKRGSALKKVG